MRTLAIRIATASLALLLVLGGSRMIGARDVTAGVTEEQMSVVMLDSSAEGPSNVAFARLTLAPSESVELAAVSGPSVHFLVEGAWSVLPSSPQVPLATTVATSTIPETQASIDGTPIDMSAESSLEPGDHLVLPSQTAVQVRNTGSVPAVSLSVAVDVSTDEPRRTGGQWQPLGDPVVVSAGTIHVRLTRMTLGPGATSAARQTEGPEALDVRQGSVVLILNPGDIRISRAGGGQETLRAGFEDPLITPEVEEEERGEPGLIFVPPGTPLPGTATGLGKGDGAVLAAGANRVLRASDEEPAVVMVVGVSPLAPVPRTPIPKDTGCTNCWQSSHDPDGQKKWPCTLRGTAPTSA